MGECATIGGLIFGFNQSKREKALLTWLTLKKTVIAMVDIGGDTLGEGIFKGSPGEAEI